LRGVLCEGRLSCAQPHEHRGLQNQLCEVRVASTRHTP